MNMALKICFQEAVQSGAPVTGRSSSDFSIGTLKSETCPTGMKGRDLIWKCFSRSRPRMRRTCPRRAILGKRRFSWLSASGESRRLPGRIFSDCWTPSAAPATAGCGRSEPNASWRKWPPIGKVLHHRSVSRQRRLKVRPRTPNSQPCRSHGLYPPSHEARVWTRRHRWSSARNVMLYYRPRTTPPVSPAAIAAGLQKQRRPRRPPMPRLRLATARGTAQEAGRDGCQQPRRLWTHKRESRTASAACSNSSLRSSRVQVFVIVADNLASGGLIGQRLHACFEGSRNSRLVRIDEYRATTVAPEESGDSRPPLGIRNVTARSTDESFWSCLEGFGGKGLKKLASLV